MSEDIAMMMAASAQEEGFAYSQRDEFKDFSHSLREMLAKAYATARMKSFQEQWEAAQWFSCDEPPKDDRNVLLLVELDPVVKGGVKRHKQAIGFFLERALGRAWVINGQFETTPLMWRELPKDPILPQEPKN